MIGAAARKVLNDPALIAMRDKWFQKMGCLKNNGEGIRLAGYWAKAEHPEFLYSDPEAWIDESLTYLAQRAQEAATEAMFVPLAVWENLYSVHYIDKLFGADVYTRDGRWYCRKLTTEVGTLEKPDLENCEAWKLGQRVAEAFLAQEVALPLFAPPIPSSPLNTAINLYGEEILVAMLTEPEAAQHDIRIIYEVIRELHEWYRDHVPAAQLQPCSPAVRTQVPGSGHICGCSCQLVSAELYEQFFMEYDDALLGLYPNGGMIHLCGDHRQHIPLFARMKNLKNIQINDRAAEDLEAYRNGLREDQVLYIQPSQGMPAKRALEITGNRRVVISYDLGYGATPEQLTTERGRKQVFDFW